MWLIRLDDFTRPKLAHIEKICFGNLKKTLHWKEKVSVQSAPRLLVYGIQLKMIGKHIKKCLKNIKKQSLIFDFLFAVFFVKLFLFLLY